MPRQKVDVDELRLRWLTALTSGVYEQAQSALMEFVEEDGNTNEDESIPTHPAYCCIGVLCDVAVELGTWLKNKPTDFRIGGSLPFGAEIPPKFLPLFGLTTDEQQEFIKMNDHNNADFEAIAAVAGGKEEIVFVPS